MAALRHRDQTGEGQHVDIAMLDALLFQSNGMLTLGAKGMPLQRMGSEVMASVPTNCFEFSDGFIYMGIILDRHWQMLCTLMGREDLAAAPGFATNVERVENRVVVNATVAQWCATQCTADAMTSLVGAGIAAARVNTYAEAAQLAQVQERDMLQTVELSNGTTAPLTGPAAKFSRTPTRIRNAAPKAGADTASVLAELGIDDAALDGLRSRGIV